MDGYVTVDEVKQSTGVRPDDLQLSTAEELDAVLDRWIAHVKGEIDDETGKDFLPDEESTLADVPHTVRSVAERAMSRWVNQVRSHRDSALIRLDDWRVGIDLVDEVLPEHLRATLRRHMRSRRTVPFRGTVVTGDSDE